MVSFCVFVFAKPLMTLFINAEETAVIEEGVRYLHIEGAFLFLNRYFVPVLWTVPRSCKTWDVRCAHHCVSRHPGGFGLCALRHTGVRHSGDLVVGAYRLAAG